MKWLKEWGTECCVSFTLILLGIIVIETISRGELSKDYGNVLVCLLWTAIAVTTLSIYPLFEKLPTLFIIILQYIIAMGLVFLTVRLVNFSEVSIEMERYKEAFISFTMFYLIGGAVFYRSQRKSVEKQNELLEDIKKLKEQKRG